MILKHVSVLLLFNCITLVFMLSYEKPVAQKLWKQRCIRNSMVLNDCNWCRCSSSAQYICDARVCREIDMFGHFNDAIQDINVGMEGHGVWRSTKTACEPGVHYTRNKLLCVCTEDGAWPNPVCRDAFRVLHAVEVVKNFKISTSQQCSPSKLYKADCNVCLCPSTGYVDPSLCSDRKCSKHDLISSRSKEMDEDEVYVECNVETKYKLGCKSCICLRNNRLLCDNCTDAASQCDGRIPGENFNVDCNICHCDAAGIIYCTTNRCLQSKVETDVMINTKTKYTSVRSPMEDIHCEPGTKYRRDCNICYCFRSKRNVKKYGCTIKPCSGQSESKEQCDLGDRFVKGCRRCQCGMYNGLKMEICEVDSRCSLRSAIEPKYREFLQECEPMQVYKHRCNTCTCSVDGKSVKCTDEPCQPVSLDIIPIVHKISDCPKGHSYKIDCNFCFCLPNGNALCTTMQCKTNYNI